MRTVQEILLIPAFRIVFMLIVALLVATESRAEVVRFETSLGDLDIELFGEAPGTVNNFKNYVTSGAYDNTIVHRNVGDFVIQGGGYGVDLSPIATDAPILNEPGISNTRGTIAMAKRGGDVHSATSQWYINIGDNSFLDSPSNGAFTVFGKVLDDGMMIVDQINELTNTNGGGPFGELPLLDPAIGPTDANLVVINRAYLVPEPSLSGAALLCFVGLGIRGRRG